MARSATELSNVDRLALAELLIRVRNSVADGGPVAVYGLADDREGEGVAHKRAQAVAAYLESLGVESSRINMETKIWQKDSPVSLKDRNQIEVEFLPACPNGKCKNPCESN